MRIRRVFAVLSGFVQCCPKDEFFNFVTERDFKVIAIFNCKDVHGYAKWQRLANSMQGKHLILERRKDTTPLDDFVGTEKEEEHKKNLHMVEDGIAKLFSSSKNLRKDHVLLVGVKYEAKLLGDSFNENLQNNKKLVADCRTAFDTGAPSRSMNGISKFARIPKFRGPTVASKAARSH